jgi:hypothetical protein
MFLPIKIKLCRVASNHASNPRHERIIYRFFVQRVKFHLNLTHGLDK